MGKPPEILVDMDDVLVDWRGELFRRASKSVDMSALLEPEAWHHPDIFACVRELYGDEAIAEMHRVVSEPNFHRDLPWIPGGKEALEEMVAHGYEVRIATWPWLGHATCAAEKLASIRKHLGTAWEPWTFILSEKSAVRSMVLLDDKPHAALFDGYEPSWVHIMFDGSPVPLSKFATHPPALRLDCWANWRNIIEPLLSR